MLLRGLHSCALYNWGDKHQPWLLWVSGLHGHAKGRHVHRDSRFVTGHDRGGVRGPLEEGYASRQSETGLPRLHRINDKPANIHRSLSMVPYT